MPDPVHMIPGKVQQSAMVEKELLRRQLSVQKL